MSQEERQRRRGIDNLLDVRGESRSTEVASSLGYEGLTCPVITGSTPKNGAIAFPSGKSGAHLVLRRGCERHPPDERGPGLQEAGSYIPSNPKMKERNGRPGRASRTSLR